MIICLAVLIFNNMKHYFLTTFACLLSLLPAAQTYHVTDEGSSVKFTIKNFGVGVDGSFRGLKGQIVFTPDHPGASNVQVSVDASTINTGIGSRDRHLKKEDYFDVTQFPELSFVSSTISGKAGAFEVQGKLTIKGTSKQISFPFTATAINGGYRFSGQFKINRRDFKVGGSSWVMSDEVTVMLNITALK